MFTSGSDRRIKRCCIYENENLPRIRIVSQRSRSLQWKRRRWTGANVAQLHIAQFFFKSSFLPADAQPHTVVSNIIVISRGVQPEAIKSQAYFPLRRRIFGGVCVYTRMYIFCSVFSYLLPVVTYLQIFNIVIFSLIRSAYVPVHPPLFLSFVLFSISHDYRFCSAARESDKCDRNGFRVAEGSVCLASFSIRH